MSYKPVIHSNAIQSMMAILKAMQQLNIEFGDTERSVSVIHILSTFTERSNKAIKFF